MKVQINADASNVDTKCKKKLYANPENNPKTIKNFKNVLLSTSHL